MNEAQKERVRKALAELEAAISEVAWGGDVSLTLVKRDFQTLDADDNPVYRYTVELDVEQRFTIRPC